MDCENTLFAHAIGGGWPAGGQFPATWPRGFSSHKTGTQNFKRRNSANPASSKARIEWPPKEAVDARQADGHAVRKKQVQVGCGGTYRALYESAHTHARAIACSDAGGEDMVVGF